LDLRNPTRKHGDLQKAAYLRGIQLYKTGSFRELKDNFTFSQRAVLGSRMSVQKQPLQKRHQYVGLPLSRESCAYAHPEKYRTSHLQT